jgi:hypothetical protein
MIELEIYAPGLRQESILKAFCSQMDLQPQVRYKIDTHHDLVYFEVDHPEHVMPMDLLEPFNDIGLSPRIVGQMPEVWQV